jgi:hypothetical protein
MLACKRYPVPARQVLGDSPESLAEVLHEGVNLAVWQRALPVPIEGFVRDLLERDPTLAESLSIAIDPQCKLQLPGLLSVHRDLDGHGMFVADIIWLLEAFACLVDARRVGLRLRSLDKPMCPRFHVDHVPLRLISAYAGVGSQWLEEGRMSRQHLGKAAAEPKDAAQIRQLRTGDVALAKGEKWLGNEGAGLIHRSPTPAEGEKRLLLTLDWLA